MISSVPLATQGGQVLLAPTGPARSQRRMAADIAEAVGRPGPVRVTCIPSAAFALCAPFSPTTRELYRQRYLWKAPSELRPGRLTTEFGLEPTPWSALIEEWAGALRPARAARS
jgi:hypothetical protein